ncbi:MAG: hypothetical protein GY945_08675 [Rhodobacteraceae bacterium]|nr:hypothetical protein [Paracoccaceae bacterium]
MIRVSFAAVCFAFFAISAWLFTAEYRAFLQDSASDAVFLRVSGKAQVELAPALSLHARINQMGKCTRLQQSILAGLYPQIARQNIAHSCNARADAILERTPTLAIAHLAKAVSLFKLGELARAFEGLERAALTAPNEGWIATLRVTLALNLAREGEAGALEIVKPDIILLLGAPHLVDNLVSIYRLWPDYQEWLVSVIELAPNPDQKRFVEALRRKVRARNDI